MLDFSPFFRWISAPRFSLLACGLLLMALAMPGRMSATHITGAEITYRCLNSSTNLYEVTVSVYRDCVNGQAPFDNNITLYIFRGANNSLFTTRNISLPNNGVEIIPAFWNSCTGQPYNLCVEYVRYVTNVVLPPTPGGYNIGWARCCRNNIVTNIAGNQGITVVAKVPGPEHAVCNNSPIFNQLPPLFLCVGQPFFFNHSAIDADGDSLVYAISNPFTGTNFGNQGATQTQPVVGTGFGAGPMGPPPYRNVNFLPGYSFSNPFGSGNFAIDPQSGALSLTPTQVGVSVFAISVFEYRNGVLLSENKRDFQINVINCQPQGLTPNLNTNTSGVPNNSNDTLFVNPLQSFCYTMTLQDPNPADVVQLFPVSAGFGIGGTLTPPYATLTTSGTNPVTGTVCWTPSCAYAGQTVNLIIGGRDTNDCPGYNLVFDTVTVVVRQPAPPTISHTGPGGSTAKVFNVNPNTNFCYNFTANDADASDVLQVTPIEGPFQALGGSGPFATLSSNGTNPVTGQVCWNIPCTAAGQTVRFVLRARDVNLCNYTVFDTVTLIIAPKPAFGASNDTSICLGQTARMTAFGGVGYNWLPQTALSNPNSPGTFASPTQTTSYQVRIFDVFGCEARDTVVVQVRPLPLANAGPDLILCPDSFVTLQATGGVSYSWSPATSLSATNIPNPQASPAGATNYVVRVTGANGCSANDTVRVNVFQASAGPGQAICFAQQTAPLSSNALNGVTYSWLPTSGLSNPNISNPVASPGTTTTYTVTITGNTGCVDTARTTVLVRPLPVVDLGAARAICFGDQATLTATGAPSFVWQPAPSLVASGANATVTPTVSTTYRATGTDGFGCFNTDSVRITVNPLPVANAGNDTVKCGDAGIVLQGSGGVSYQWSPATGLSNTAISNPTANPDSSTTYVLRVTDANGCQDTDTVFLRTMYANAGPDQPLCIFDTLSLSASGGVAYQWNPEPDLTGGNTATPQVFPLATRAYSVLVTDISGCTDRDTMLVTVNPLPVTSTSGTDPFVCSNGGTRVNATGGVNYLWSPAVWFPQPDTASPVAFPIYSGIPLDSTVWFYVTVTDANGCSSRDSLSQVVRKQPVITTTPDTVKCPGTTVTLRATGGIAYEWFPATALSATNVPVVVANPLVTTDYAVRIAAVWGCADTGYVRVIVMDPDAGPDVTICFGDTIVLGGRGGVAFSWDNGAFLSQTNISDPRAFPPDTTDFVLTVTDSVGCVDTDTVRINVKPAPPANAGPDQAICFGDTAQFVATGGVAYLWLANDSISQTNIPNPQVWPGTSRDYVVIVSGANQCSWPDTLTLTVNPLPVADAGPDVVKCGESPIPLNGSGGVQYEWTPANDLSDPLIANPLAGPDSSATYALLVTDINGCQDTDTMNITAMYANAGPGGTICEGDSIRLQGSGGISYRWSPGLLVTDSLSASPLAFPGVTTDFIVTAFDPSGCSDTNVVRIVVNAYPPAFAGPDTAICINDTLRLRASGGVSFAWAPSPFIADVTNPGSPAWPTVSSTFVVAVTDTNGCTQFDSVRITVNPLPLASAGPDRTKCGEDSVLLAGSGGVLYEWTPALALNDPLIAQPLASPDSATQYTVRVTDANGCVNFDSVQVETLYANAGPDLSKCPEDSVQLFYGVIGGNPVSRVYLPAPGLIAPAQQNFVYITAGLTNDYVLEITDASGCVDRDTVNVFVFTSPPADAGRDTAICIFEATPLTATGGIAFDWRSDRDLSAFSGATVTASPRVSKYFFVTVTDTNGCRATDSVRVTVNPLPEVGAGFDTTICARSAAFLEATGALTYVWTPDGSLTDPLNATTVAAPEFTTMYTVTGTDGNGCRNVDSVQVNVRDLPTLQTDLERRMCAGQEIWLRASGAQQIRWFDNQQGDSVRVAPMSTRTYWVQPFNDGCPGDTFFIEVEVVRDLPIARFEPDPAQGFYPLTVNFTNTSEFASVYRWDFGDGNFSEAENPSHEFVEPGQYAVRLLADNGLGCPDTFTYTFIDAWNFTVYYPNAFTPNGDGTNDEFFIEMNSIREVRMEIFNQWGELIYVSDDPDFRWDGTHQGRDVQEGVYVFHFRAVTFRGEVVERGGTITLIR